MAIDRSVTITIGRSVVYRANVLCLIILVALSTALSASAENGAGRSPIIDNERVKIWDIILSEGQFTNLGPYQNDFVAMFLVGARLRITNEDGRATVSERRFGEAVYGRKGTERRYEAISGGPARVIIVELKDHSKLPYANNSGFPPAFPRPGSTKVLDNARVVVWNYSWTSNVPTPMHFHDKDVVVVYRYDGSLKSTTPDGKSIVNDYKSGSIWFNPGNRAHFEELVKGQQSAMMMELK